MNRNLLVTIIVVILIVGAGGYFLMNRQTAEPAGAPENVQPSAQVSPTTQKTSLKNFMSMMGTQQCQFNDDETGNSGIVYLDSGKMRGDFSSNINGKVTPTHMINDNEDIYIWTDGQQMGFKTSIEAIEAVSGQTGTVETVDINKQVDYKCESWTPDPVKFAVPAEIKFQSMDDMMKNMRNLAPGSSPSGSAPIGNPQACAACNSLEGAQIDQCKAALKCN